MNFIKKLKSEHEEIERELLELETITNLSDEEINYPNLVHVLKKLFKIWDFHEQKEEKIFLSFKKEKIIIPVEKMTFDHRKLKKHKENIKKALDSNSEFEIKKMLKIEVKEVIKKLRVHIEDEENTLLILPVLDLFSNEQIMHLNKIAGPKI